MANEMDLSYAGTATLYAIIRKVSDGTVCTQSTLAFGAWADGSVANYDFALTSQGGDYYAANFPALAAGVYRVTYYEQAGATPAITDLLLKSEQIEWDGSAVAAAASSDLTTLALVKEYLNITATTWDNAITRLVTNVSAAITKYCERDSFLLATYSGVINGPGANYLYLTNIPIVSITSIVFDYNETNSETVTETSPATEFDFEAQTGKVMFKPTSTNRQSFSYGFKNILPTYAGGYSTIPGDLELAATMAVATVFQRSKRDPTVTSERIGDYSYTRAAGELAMGAPWFSEVRTLLYAGGYKPLPIT